MRKKIDLKEAYIDPVGTLQEKFGVNGFPITIIVDKNAQRLKKIEGYSSENIKVIEKLLDTLKN